MTMPSLGNFAEELYAALEPLAYDDENQGYALAHFCESVGVMLEDVYNYITETDEFEGWATVMDADEAPADVLPWLGQFGGVRLVSDLTEQQQRDTLKDAPGFKRGSLSAIENAAKAFLTGNKTVYIQERYNPGDPNVDSAYHLTVTVIDSEAADPARVEASVVKQKPAGIILHFQTTTGQDWQNIDSTMADWDQVDTDFASWQEVFDN